MESPVAGGHSTGGHNHPSIDGNGLITGDGLVLGDAPISRSLLGTPSLTLATWGKIAMWTAMGASMLMKPPGLPSAGVQVNLQPAGPNAPLPIVFGRTGVQGFITYREAYPDAVHNSSKNNTRLDNVETDVAGKASSSSVSALESSVSVRNRTFRQPGQPTNPMGGYTVEYYAHGITNSGRKSATWNMVVWNLTENVQISSRTASVTVDADNNYNLPDYTVNTPSLPALTLYTNESSGWTNTAAWTVSGINRPITVRFTRGNQVDSGGSFTRRFFIYHSTNGGASWTEYFIGAGTQGVLDLVVNNGDLIHMRTYFDTSQGRGDSSFNAYITNLTTGAGIATLTVTGTTDADNNYNIGGAVNAVDWPNMSVFLNSTNGSSTMPNYTDGAARTISGLASGQTATISLSGSADGDAQGWVEVWKNGVNQGIKFLSAQNTNAVNTNYAAVSVVNGDTIHFRVGVNGPLATQFNTPVSVYKSLAVTVNASPGGAIDTFNASLTHSDSYSSGGGIGEPGGPIIRD